MNSSTHSSDTQHLQKPKGDPQQTPEAEPKATARACKNPNTVIEDQHEKPPDRQLTEPSYREIPTRRSAILLCYIIAGNCLLSGIICLCLWRFSKIKDFTQWQKRAFNTTSLLLSASLGFGIGYLFDQIGLLARGTLIQGKPHSAKEVGYIMRGTLLSYASLFIHQVRTRRGLGASTTWVLFLFLVCSLLGRFGVAFLGFAFNLEEKPYYTHRLFRPDWVNGAVNGDDSVRMALASELSPLPNTDVARTAFNDSGMAGVLFEMAQTTKGLPWLLPRSRDYLPYLNNTQTTIYAMNISHFPNANLTMEVLAGSKVSFKYKFQDFRGTAAIFAGWALVETICQEFVSSQDIVTPLTTSNFTEYSLGAYDYRWIFPMVRDQYDGGDGGLIHRNATIQMWLVGRSENYDVLPMAIGHSYVANQSIVFNCSVYLDSGMIAQRIHDYLRLSLALPSTGVEDDPEKLSSNIAAELFRDSKPPFEFNFGVSRQNRSTSALWLSAYIGNYIGNCLSFLSDILGRVEIERGTHGIITKLLVQWDRVATMLGILAGLQVLFGLAALLYCSRGLEIVFAVQEEMKQKDTVHQGKFVPEGDGVHWVFVAGAGKGIKVT